MFGTRPLEKFCLIFRKRLKKLIYRLLIILAAIVLLYHGASGVIRALERNRRFIILREQKTIWRPQNWLALPQDVTETDNRRPEICHNGTIPALSTPRNYANQSVLQTFTPSHPVLVDISAQTFYKLGINRQQIKASFEPNATAKENKISVYNVLWFNQPKWISLRIVRGYSKNCPYKNCNHINDVSRINQSSAVIFYTSGAGIKPEPPLQPWERPAGQVWVFFSLESPETIYYHHQNNHPIWKNSMNWSMSFRLDSDVVLPYSVLRTNRRVLKRNYSEIYRKKTKLAAWVVSNCKPNSLRDQFVEKLKNYGFSVDVFGRCGKKVETDPKIMINKTYKFYLSFENSMCQDYITEKFFGYYSLNTILIVRGGSDYKRLLPADTYINTADFDDFPKLVTYLERVGSNETLYIDYLKRKDRYTVHGAKDLSFCSMCAKLNNLEENKRVYETVPWYLETCFAPNDIKTMDTNNTVLDKTK